MSPLVHAAAIADFVNPFANLPAGTGIGFIYSGWDKPSRSPRDVFA